MNYLFLDNGFEEIEAITVVDLLRRAGIPLTTVSITGKPMVLGAHNVAVEADGLFENVDFDDAEMLILPGGQTKLDQHNGLCELLTQHNEADKLIAAICAAPSVLGKLGILKGKQATCYPGFEKFLNESYVDSWSSRRISSPQKAPDSLPISPSASSRKSKAPMSQTKSMTRRNTNL